MRNRPPTNAKPARDCLAHVCSAQQELDVLIRARYPIIYVVSWEEERVEQCLREIAEAPKKNLFVWTVTQGIVKSGSEPQQSKAGGGNTADPAGRAGCRDQPGGAGDLPVQGFPPLHRG